MYKCVDTYEMRITPTLSRSPQHPFEARHLITSYDPPPLTFHQHNHLKPLPSPVGVRFITIFGIMSTGNVTGVVLRRMLGLLKTSWESFDEDFQTWHRDPAHPDRQLRSRKTIELKEDVETLAALVGPKYWGPNSSHLAAFAAQWPDQKEL